MAAFFSVCFTLWSCVVKIWIWFFPSHFLYYNWQNSILYFALLIFASLFVIPVYFQPDIRSSKPPSVESLQFRSIYSADSKCWSIVHSASVDPVSNFNAGHRLPEGQPPHPSRWSASVTGPNPVEQLRSALLGESRPSCYFIFWATANTHKTREAVPPFLKERKSYWDAELQKLLPQSVRVSFSVHWQIDQRLQTEAKILQFE